MHYDRAQGPSHENNSSYSSLGVCRRDIVSKDKLFNEFSDPYTLSEKKSGLSFWTLSQKSPLRLLQRCRGRVIASVKTDDPEVMFRGYVKERFKNTCHKYDIRT